MQRDIYKRFLASPRIFKCVFIVSYRYNIGTIWLDWVKPLKRTSKLLKCSQSWSGPVNTASECRQTCHSCPKLIRSSLLQEQSFSSVSFITWLFQQEDTRGNTLFQSTPTQGNLGCTSCKVFTCKGNQRCHLKDNARLQLSRRTWQSHTRSNFTDSLFRPLWALTTTGNWQQQITDESCTWLPLQFCKHIQHCCL